MAFIPKTTNNTVILKRSYTDRHGTYTAGHRFEKQDYMFQGKYVLIDDHSRILMLTPYELERVT